MTFQNVVVSLALFAVCVSGRSMRNFHPYMRANIAEGDVRSPCPGLNTLANHGILPRNGKAITAEMLSTSIQSTYNIDSTLGYSLGHLSIPLVENNSLTATTLDLDHLNLHDAIEHDASLSRFDFVNGDNHSPQPELITAMLNDAENGFVTVASLAKTRVRREKDSQAKGASALTIKSQTLAYGEAALLLQALGIPDAAGELKVPVASVKTWFADEKLPSGYTKPAKAISLSSSSSLASTIQTKAKALKGK